MKEYQELIIRIDERVEQLTKDIGLLRDQIRSQNKSINVKIWTVFIVILGVLLKVAILV